MNILVITKSAWDDKIAVGNTLSNLFDGWPDTVFYNIYCRDAKPNNTCCKNYYSVSPLNIVKNTLTPWRVGNQFVASAEIGKDSVIKNTTEQSLTNISRGNNLIYSVYDAVYSTKTWLNKKLRNYLNGVKPDVVFCFGIPDAFNYYLVKYIKSHFSCPIIVYFMDDVFGVKNSRWNFLGKVNRRRLFKLAEIADKRYAISQLMCDEYSYNIGKDFDLLYKGCEISRVTPKGNNPIRLTYAGNLFYHRDCILAQLAEAIFEINKDTPYKAHLDIYTGTPVNDTKEKQLSIEGTSTLHPAKSFVEIKKIMTASDIVLHVESFDETEKKTVRLSFSTKITDCLQSGAMVMAIGPNDIASIDFLTHVPGAVVVDNLNNLKSTLNRLLLNPEEIEKRAKETNSYANNNMTIEKVRKRLQNDFISISRQKDHR